jgi:hypothetical protein
MFIYKVHKDDEASIEDFTSAVNCAKECIENVLYDLSAVITVTDDLITITTDDITKKECKDKIQGCFCDNAGNVYPEFLRVELL